MIAKITPLIRLPARTDVFDYFVPKELLVLPGHLVRIPFRSSKVAGVILGLSKHQESKKFRARPIDSLIEETPVLSSAQLQLIQKFSKYYFVSPGSVARLIVPEKPERKSRILEKTFPVSNFKITKQQLAKLKTESTKIQDQQFIQIQDVSSFAWLLLHLVKHTKDKQLLVLIPTLEMLEQIASIVHKKYSNKLSVVHSGISKTQHWNEYQKILAGESRVILSTRQGVFLPIQNNSQIIFFDSTSVDFKQYDQHPRYDARIVGTWLANSTKSKLLFATSSELLTEKGAQPLELPRSRTSEIKVNLVDMKNEMQQKNFSIIAHQTLEIVRETIAQEKQVVVLALREESDKGVSARSLLEILTKELKNCKVSSSEAGADVLVGVPRILEGSKLRSYDFNPGLLVFASVEPLFAIPDYRSQERAFYRLSHWKMLATELGFKRIVLQSYSPDILAIQAFALGDFQTFKNQELANRKELNYPPFSKLIKLSYRGKNQSAPLELKQRLPQTTGPFIDANKRPSLLIKLVSGMQIPDLSKLSIDWSIDRDPENIL